MALQDGWDRELLDGGRAIIAAKRNVLQHDRMQAGIGKRADGVNLDRAFLSDFNALDAAPVRKICTSNRLGLTEKSRGQFARNG